MKKLRIYVAMAMALAASACASIETATRNAPLETPEVEVVPVSVTVEQINVSVPRSLRVSEANLYYPLGDIVWREDPLGDRHEQVRTIVEAGLKQGAESLKGTVPVILDVEVTRFHSLTEKARYTIGGVHSIKFKMTMRNPETGEVYGEPRVINADLKAFGGARAINAERNGITQKYRITNHLADLIQRELTENSNFVMAQQPLLLPSDQI